MSTSRANTLSLILAILGIVIGLPGFVDIMFGERTGLGILSAVIGVLIIGGAVWLWLFLRRPDFTLVNVEKTLTFADKDAHRAIHVCTQTIRANHKGLTEFWFRGITSDGSVQNIRIDDRDPDLEQTQSGQKEVCKRFSNSLQRGDEVRLVISMDVIDAFPERTEHFIHRVTNKTKRVRLTVQFHPDRPYRSARAFLQYGGQKHKPVEHLKQYSNGIELEIKRPKLGEEYRLEWEWMPASSESGNGKD